MKILLKIYLFTHIAFILGCKNNKPEKNPIKSNTIITNQKELFKTFFEKFKVDSSFQKKRIYNPLDIWIADENGIEQKKELIEYVSFIKKDWGQDILLSEKVINTDTVKVTLQGKDTGIFIEHYFVCKNGEWHLYLIKNNSD